MGKFKTLRDALESDLNVISVPVMQDWLVRAEPPCILIAAPISNQYVTEGKEFGAVVLNLDVVVLVNAHPQADARNALEELLEDVLRNSVDWALIGVDAPGTASLPDSTVEFLGTVVHLGKSVQL